MGKGRGMDEGQMDTMRLIRQLVGRWAGAGMARYPTITSFDYREELEFTIPEGKPLVHYDQRTSRRSDSGGFVTSHWETGFWRVLSATEIELLCAQSGGRVEVARGTLTPTENGFVVRLASTLIGNDPRMDKTAREVVLKGDMLSYALRMSTTAVPELTTHVSAELKRIT